MTHKVEPGECHEDTPSVLDTAQPISTSRRMRQYLLYVQLTDIAVITMVVASALTFRFAAHSFLSTEDPQIQTLKAIVPSLCILWFCFLRLTSAYDPHFVGSDSHEYSAVFRATITTFGILAITSYAFKLEVARSLVLISLPAGLLLLTLSHWSWRKWLIQKRRQGYLVNRVLAVGDYSAIALLAATLDKAPEAGYKVVAACCSNAKGMVSGPNIWDIPIVGGELDAVNIAANLNVDIVACARSGTFGSIAVRELAWKLEGSNQELIIVPSLIDIAGPRVSTRPVNGMPLLIIEQPTFSGLEKAIKEVLDRSLSILGALLVSPLFILIALAIKIDDRGPVFFTQERIGINGDPFTMLKFRSMRVNAEKQHAKMMQQLANADGVERGPLFKAKDDPRITRVGKWLRRTSLDELPQLINIAKGDMSLVGPRPPLPSEVASYDGRVNRRLLVKPGLTGLWQVSGRSNLSWDESVRLDLYYVENWSLIGDLVILFRTAKAVFSNDGAY